MQEHGGWALLGLWCAGFVACGGRSVNVVDAPPQGGRGPVGIMEGAGNGGRASVAPGARGGTGGADMGNASNGGAMPARGGAGHAGGRTAGGSPGASGTTAAEAGETGQSGNDGAGGEPPAAHPTLPPGIFDPKEVYLWGTVAPGLRRRIARRNGLHAATPRISGDDAPHERRGR